MTFDGIRRMTSAALITCTLAACTGDDDGPTGDTAQLRLLHARPTQGAIDVDIGGRTVIQGVTYGNASAVAGVPGGRQRVVVRSGSQVLRDFDQVLSGQVVNSLLVSADSVQFADEVVPDTGSVAIDRANIRLVNVVGPNGDPPTLLHAKLRAPAPDSIMTFGMDTRVARYGTLMYFDPGEFTIRFQPMESSTVLAEATFTVAAGETRAVVLQRAENGDYAVTIVEEE